jgi:SAM-dependent methyltransferase
LDDLLDQSRFSSRWQRGKWTLKYLLGHSNYVPDFDTLLARAHRRYLLDVINTLGPWRSALEIGCGRGANLYLLARANPGAVLAGVDISALAVRQTRAELDRRALSSVRLEVSDAVALTAFTDDSFDVVFSDAVHMYVPPDRIATALGEMARTARMGVVISTWHEDSVAGAQPWRHDEGAWVYDYPRLLRENFGLSASLVPYPNGAWQDARWLRYGCVVRVRSTGEDRSEARRHSIKRRS